MPTTKPALRVAVLGAGSWGTALALVLARNGHAVSLWGHRPEAMAVMAEQRCNRDYLPDIALPDSIHPTADLDAAVADVDHVLMTVPSAGFAELTARLAPVVPAHASIAWATKGLQADGHGLLHGLVAHWLPGHPRAILSGPSFAGEVARGLPTAVVLASDDGGCADTLAAAFHDERFRVYTSPDVIGVEVGGAVKNVLAIATGIADGLALGANARAGLITRGLAEIRRLGVALGAADTTLTGLAGMGDLILTCTDDQSRNRRMGLALGQGHTIDQAAEQIGQVVEGLRTAGEVTALGARLRVELPICSAVEAVIQGQVSPSQAAQALMQRDPTAEFSGF
ncbi:MAG: NAD(P)H-dependent glycerol-3-phosphate dehydrogenase [Spiribacter sp.]|jgi:glycerol 3-phosphate dehydrogenase (NAD(P)+) (EC 1.1.1.94)|nr:NAD(P)H-dependent glycerol-3-phosphate dehydrogenase [Spiribacter sp.]MDR9479977.1 NAD(P)H-dependent glycerol-3-phosphate dehydrogenase [Spiribacter sp.]